MDEITGKIIEYNETVENSGYTILYNPNDPTKSLLDRALHDRAPDWSVAHVDDTIASKQRTFSVSEQTIYDFFTNTVANELSCLFKFDSVNRQIYVYDLLNTCSECGYRGEFTDKCPKCDSTNYIRGYGNDSHVYISASNYASKITVDGDEGSVKNCFKVTGGDDLMSATVKNSNPSGSDLIYKFSDADLDDMPDGLRDALIAYYEDYDRLNAQYQECLKDYYNALNTYYYYKTSMMPRFNAEYHHWQPNHGYDVGNKVYVITLPSWCYLECVQAGTSGSEEFDATYLDDSGDPSNPTIIEDGTVKWKVVKHIVEIPAASQAMNDVVAYLANANNKIYFEPVDNSDPLNKADTTISRYVEDLIRSLINPLFKVEILEDGRTWSHTTGTNTGTLAFYLKITNTTNPNEVVTSKDLDSQGHFIWNNGNALVAHCQVAGNAQELENYLLQLTKKRMDRKDTKFQSLWEIESDVDFKELLQQYSLDLLDGFAKSYGDCRDVLLANGIKDGSSEFHGVRLYNQVYAPYNTRLGYIDAEIKTREETVKYWYNDPDQKDDSTSDIPVGKKVPYDGSMPPGQVQVAYNAMVAIQKQLDLKNALGEYWSTFFNYIREGEYNNSNYISDGLSNNLLVDDANELLGKARLELEKASELQYTLSDDLNNLLNTEEFAPFKDKFKLGDFIMCGVGDSGEASDLDMDDHLYKLRLIQVSYQYNSPGSLSVTFSNVTKIKNYFSDTQDVLAQAKSMGTSYNAVTQQVERNKETTNQVNTWNTNGLNSALVKILNNNNEEVTYDNSGITLREYDYSYDTKEEHSDPSETYSSNDQGYNNKQLRITHNMLAFTTDNWKTASLALGELNYTYFNEHDVRVNNAVGYGLISQFVTAGTINGSQIIGGKLYSTNYSTLNPAGTRMDLDTGDLSVGGGKLKYTAGTGKLEIDGTVHATNLVFDNVLKTKWTQTQKEYNLVEHYARAEESGAYINTAGNLSTSGGIYHAINLIGYNAGELADYRGQLMGNWNVNGNVVISGNVTSYGTKARTINTSSYGDILQYAYEMPTPTFGDIGDGLTDQDGICLVYLDDKFIETINNNCEYQVFLQSYGDGNVYVSKRTPSYFVVNGTPNMSFGWEIKAVQRDYELNRLDQFEDVFTKDNDFHVLENTWSYLDSLLYDIDEEEI